MRYHCLTDTLLCSPTRIALPPSASTKHLTHFWRSLRRRITRADIWRRTAFLPAGTASFGQVSEGILGAVESPSFLIFVFTFIILLFFLFSFSFLLWYLIVIVYGGSACNYYSWLRSPTNSTLVGELHQYAIITAMQIFLHTPHPLLNPLLSTPPWLLGGTGILIASSRSICPVHLLQPRGVYTCSRQFTT